jgi:hypothetical protein
MTQGKKMKTVPVGIVGAGARGRTRAGTLGTRIVDADLALSRSERGVRFSSDFTIRFPDAYTRQMLAWIRSVHDGRAVGASAVDGLRTTLVAEHGGARLAVCLLGEGGRLTASRRSAPLARRLLGTGK